MPITGVIEIFLPEFFSTLNQTDEKFIQNGAYNNPFFYNNTGFCPIYA